MVGRDLPGGGLEPGFQEALASLPRVACPEFAIDTIVERGRMQRYRTLLRGVVVAVALVAAGVLLLQPEPEAPVHLKLQLIEAPAADSVQIGGRTVGEWDLLVDGVPGEVEAP